MGSSFRLPDHTRPTRYDIELTPDLAAATFGGTVAIAVTTTTASPTIELNAADLVIEWCRFDGVAVEWSLDAETERMTLTPAGGVSEGDHSVEIGFVGVLNDQLRGWYRSTYVDDAGNEHVIATSQMQSTDCRRAFPCWDEPAFKAVFGITLVVPEALMAISNGAEMKRTPTDDGRVRVQFNDTMKMSSYLVAMVVGPLEATAWMDVDGIPLRIVHVPGKGHLTEFGLDVAAFSLRWFQNYYGIAYPGDKVELVALPDFAAGAMENLGCITFREAYLLVDPDTATQSERQAVADVVAHELAHMWFGDLVTMEWWNGIWLNEAFATFMELAACDAFRPDWERWTAFALERSVAFETDSLRATRPVEYEVNSPADAEGMFDVLTYQKGGALLRMLEQHLGTDAFRDGVRLYLDRHRYGNTETADLWDAIEEATGQPVRAMMDSWIWQPGYPLISARLDGDDTLALSQRRFRFATDHPASGADDERWMVPISVRSGSDEASLTLDQAEATVSVTQSGGPIVVNAGGNGFFRVAYDPDLLARFDRDALATMNTVERYSLVDDTWNAVFSGAATSADFLSLTSHFADERSPDVWKRIGLGFSWLRRLIDDPDALASLRTRVIDLANPALERLGEPGPNDSDLDRSARGTLLSMVAITGEHRPTIERAEGYYRAWDIDPASVDAELAAAATAVVASFGDESVYATFVNRFETADNPQTKLRHLYALPDFGDEALLKMTCELAFSDRVKSQEAPFLLNGCIANRQHGRLAWEYVKDHWDQANERFPRNAIVRMISSVRTLDRDGDVADVSQFFADHPIEQAVKTLQQVLERQAVNAAMRTREAAGLTATLKG